jgi:MFS family permease
LIYAVLGNYAVNFAIPRGGEIWRCTVIAAKEKISLSKLIGTLVVDRIFDMLMVALIILLAFSLNAKAFFRYAHNINVPELFFSAAFYIGLLASMLAIAAFLFFFRKNKYIKKTQRFFINLWKDMLSVKKMEEKGRFLVYTLAIWILYFFYFYITFYAFDFTSHLGITIGLFVFAISSLSMGIPSNGGLGPWQAATVLGLSIFAIANAQATAFATTVFAVQSIGIVLTGLWGIVMLSIKKGKNKEPENAIS